MTVRVTDDGRIELSGECPSAQADLLLQHLCAEPGRRVDWRTCTSAHTAVIQVLVAAGIAPLGPPSNTFLAEKVQPLLEGVTGAR